MQVLRGVAELLLYYQGVIVKHLTKPLVITQRSIGTHGCDCGKPKAVSWSLRKHPCAWPRQHAHSRAVADPHYVHLHAVELEEMSTEHCLYQHRAACGHWLVLAARLVYTAYNMYMYM